MQSDARPTAPPAPSGPSAPAEASVDALLIAELALVTASARRRASRDGDRQIDTAHLLHSLLESDPLVRAAFQPTQIARLLGYLVQRSIGFGLQWKASVEASAELPFITRRDAGSATATATATAATPSASPSPVTASSKVGTRGRGADRWSPAAATALYRAVSRARGRGRERADGADLLAALAADSESRAVMVLRSAGVDIARTVSALP